MVKKTLYDAVSVYLVSKFENDWKILLGYHLNHNAWLPIAGKKKLNEFPDDTARREVKEELGVEIAFLQYKPPRPGNQKEYAMPFLVTRQPKKDGTFYYDQAYLCAPESLDFTINEEFSTVAWFDENGLENAYPPIKPGVKFSAIEAIATIKKLEGEKEPGGLRGLLKKII
ncbi:MAG: NUDIX domain-containing protein [Nanoarchaeota archaeon]